MKINSFKWRSCWSRRTWQTPRGFSILPNQEDSIIQIILIRAKITPIPTSSTIRHILVTIKCWLFKIHSTITIWAIQDALERQVSWVRRATATRLNLILDWWVWARVTRNLYKALNLYQDSKAHVKMILRCWPVLMWRTGMRTHHQMVSHSSSHSSCIIIQSRCSRWLHQKTKFHCHLATWRNCQDTHARSSYTLRATTLSTSSTKQL